MLTMTAGSSQAAKKEIPSCLRLIPGLEEEVIARTPTMLAPYTMFMAAISLSAWTKAQSFFLARCAAIYSINSFCGVMG
jgi:hypothetical protein